MFVSGLDESTLEPVKQEAPEVHEDTPEGSFGNSVLNDIPVHKKEKKDRRVQLLMQPSLHKKATALADAYGMSFNEFVHQILEKITEG